MLEARNLALERYILLFCCLSFCVLFITCPSWCTPFCSVACRFACFLELDFVSVGRVVCGVKSALEVHVLCCDCFCVVFGQESTTLTLSIPPSRFGDESEEYFRFSNLYARILGQDPSQIPDALEIIHATLQSIEKLDSFVRILYSLNGELYHSQALCTF